MSIKKKASIAARFLRRRIRGETDIPDPQVTLLSIEERDDIKDPFNNDECKGQRGLKYEQTSVPIGKSAVQEGSPGHGTVSRHTLRISSGPEKK